MIWLQPWAWIGLAAIAVPVLVHLFAKQRARVERFPTLRFLQVSSAVPVRRRQISDWLLLVIRAAIVAAAVAALAQPLMSTGARDSALESRVARAILIDASESMRRPSTNRQPAIEIARARAREMVADAAAVTTGEAVDLAAAIRGASVWLSAQAGRRELVILSDFALGALDAADLSDVTAGAGVRLVRIDIDSASVAAGDGRRTTPSSPETAAPAVAVLVGPERRGAADAAVEAARTDGARSARADWPVAIVFPDASERRALAGSAKLVDRPWMITVVSRLLSDDALRDSARDIVEVSEPLGELESGKSTTIVSTPAGKPLLAAAASGDRLMLFSMAPPGTLFSAALIAAAERAIDSSLPASELETRLIADDQLRRWEREPGAAAPATRESTDESDGRWFWMAALALLGIETWLRRRQSAPAKAPEVVHARVA